MAKEELIPFDGEVLEILPNSEFRVQLENRHQIIAYIAGRMRRFRIKILVGDKIRVEMSPYDLTRGRVVHRY